LPGQNILLISNPLDRKLGSHAEHETKTESLFEESLTGRQQIMDASSTLVTTGAIASNPIEDNFYTPANQDFYSSNPYSDLDPSRHEIRLLELLPAKDDEPLRANLLTKCFLSGDDGEPPSYCAISYFAGNHKDTEVVYVNGVRFNAFTNLSHALRQVLKARERRALEQYPQLIWADQICINQSKISERSHQVGFMRKIYESAEAVFASLGWEDPSHGRWVTAAEKLGVEFDSGIYLEDTTVFVKDRIFADLCDEKFQSAYSDFSHILHSTWWRRGWVYQEVLVAQELLVLFGFGCLAWNKIASAVNTAHKVMDYCGMQLLYGHLNALEPTFKALFKQGKQSDFATFMIRGRIDWKRRGQTAIVLLLQHAQECRVTDIRDRVFAFIGLADPGYRIIPDYAINVPTMLRHLCKRIILYEDRLNILCSSIKAGPDSDHRERRADIPTWTPDWTNNKIYFDCSVKGSKASSNHPAAAAFLPHAGVLDYILRVQCVFVDDLSSHDMHVSLLTSKQREFPHLVWEERAGIRQTSEADGQNVMMYPHKPSISIDIAYINTIMRGRQNFLPENISRNNRDLQIHGDLDESFKYGEFFRSPRGYFVMLKNGAQAQYSDRICILLGADVPFVVRKVEDHYILVSDAYVEGLMHGEAIKLVEQGKLAVETIDLY
jgi:hypothetical protein